MRKCEGCSKKDSPYYDYRQHCSCNNEREHGIDRHAPDCFRVRHSVRKYRTELRLIKKTDQFENGLLVPAPNDEHEYLKKNGFRIAPFNDKLYAERVLCRACIRVWNERQENKAAFEKAKRRPQQNYYQMLCE
jgi:hypothetical protein